MIRHAAAQAAALASRECKLGSYIGSLGRVTASAYAGAYGERSFTSGPAQADGTPAPLRAPFPILGFVRFVPEKQACVVERFGRFNRVLHPGFNMTVPVVENVAYTHSLKELTLLVNTQQAITKDNVTIRIDAVLYIRIVDPFKASYGVDKPLYAVMQLAQTSMRSELGKMTLDNTFEERDALNDKIVQVINSAAKSWGLECLRYEIRDIVPPPGIVRAMELQAEAERRKRAQVLESEGVRQATINESEARRESAINNAIGEAETISRRSQATADGVKMIAEAIALTGGADAVSMTLAQQYVEAFGKIAQTGNTMIVPADASNVAGMVAQATTVFKAMTKQSSGRSAAGAGGLEAGQFGFQGAGEQAEQAKRNIFDTPHAQRLSDVESSPILQSTNPAAKEAEAGRKLRASDELASTSPVFSLQRR